MTNSTTSNQFNGRLTPAQQFERLLLVIALLGLALTGLSQKFSSEAGVQLLIRVLGGIESVRILHRFFALLLLAEMIYHVTALGYRWSVRGLRPIMLPGLQAWRDLGQQFLSNLGFTRAPASVGFTLKIEYLVLGVSILLLGLTGLILWNPIAVTNSLSGETIPLARSIHSEHALLLVIFLVLWRVGMVLWQPRRSELIAEQESRATAQSNEILTQRRNRFMVIALPVVVIVSLGLVWWITAEQTAINTVPRREAAVFAPQTIPETGDPAIGKVLWSTLRCTFCHGEQAEGIADQAPALPTANLSFELFYQQVREGSEKMPAFSYEELPDGYLVHLWSWLTASPRP